MTARPIYISPKLLATSNASWGVDAAMLFGVGIPYW
jgi:hypothetical protein